MGFYMQEYWSGLPLPSPGDLPDLGIELDYVYLGCACLAFCQTSPPRPASYFIYSTLLSSIACLFYNYLWLLFYFWFCSFFLCQLHKWYLQDVIRHLFQDYSVFNLKYLSIGGNNHKVTPMLEYRGQYPPNQWLLFKIFNWINLLFLN